MSAHFDDQYNPGLRQASGAPGEASQDERRMEGVRMVESQGHGIAITIPLRTHAGSTYASHGKPRIRKGYGVWSCCGYHEGRYVMGFSWVSGANAWDDWLANCWRKQS